MPDSSGGRPRQAADQAGGRPPGPAFGASAFGGDDGRAPAELLRVLALFRSRAVAESAVVDVLRTSRLLIPLLTELRAPQAAPRAAGAKRAELSAVTVRGPDGRSVLPVFSSVAAMSAWNPTARPVPATAVRVAQAAAAELTELVVVDPTADTEFALRRPALAALGRGLPWQPSHRDDAVRQAIIAATALEAAVEAVDLLAGDPSARLAGPELIVRLHLAPGLTPTDLDQLLARVSARWAASAAVAERVDSMAVRIVPTGTADHP